MTFAVRTTSAQRATSSFTKAPKAAPSRALGFMPYFWAVARIGYTAVDGPLARDGWLVYVKPMLRGDEPPDVRNYASGSPSFPHETTANQWFNESQTESYRALGAQSIDDLVHGLGLGPDDLARRAEAAWKQ